MKQRVRSSIPWRAEERAVYSDGKKVSAEYVCRQWDENGHLLGSVRMKMGTGLDLWWGPGPRFPTEERYYFKDQRHGYERWRFRKNEIFEESHFHHGAEHGVFRRWKDPKLERGYPKFYVHGKRATKRAYLAAAAWDETLPPYLQKEDSPRRKPVIVPAL